ncbi:MAG: hypothetical protein OXN27_10200 [Candidatus Poribacteria bacterium]|nr:hypothetical protein [Candidatus Poribacteria bacterium]
MKIFGLVLAIVCFLCFSPSVFAELSVEDLEKIRQIVNEFEVSLGKRIDAVETRLDKRIDEVEVRLGKRINEVEKQLGDRITSESQAQGKRIDFQGHLIIALIVAIIAFVAVPMGVIVYQYNRNRDQQEAEIRAVRDQQEEIKVLRQRIEELERERLMKA